MSTTRRRFLETLPALGALPAALGRRASAASDLAAAVSDLGPRAAPEDVARDEDFWAIVARAFPVDRSMINLNNGGVSPTPREALEAMKRHLDFSNALPAYTMWRVLEPQREGVRQRLARAFGCDPEEVAITRNASEGLETCQLGIDLRAGDRILTSDQDYPRMVNTFRQRARREGVVLDQVELPVPAEDPGEIVRRFEERITERTRLMLICHVINLTGQILPVGELVAMARRHGVPVIVDGAHALAHLDFQLRDLGCDYYASSLHKWLSAPHGTGFLYVRRDRIRGLWPLMAAPPGRDDDIRKFEEIGTHPAANALAIAEALTLHELIGAARKQARLLYLRDLWAQRLAAHPRVRLRTSLKPGCAAGLATFDVEGVDPEETFRHLWNEHRIRTSPIRHERVRGVRVSPGIYTTRTEIERFCDAVERFLGR